MNCDNMLSQCSLLRYCADVYIITCDALHHGMHITWPPSGWVYQRSLTLPRPIESLYQQAGALNRRLVVIYYHLMESYSHYKVSYVHLVTSSGLKWYPGRWINHPVPADSEESHTCPCIFCLYTQMLCKLKKQNWNRTTTRNCLSPP